MSLADWFRRHRNVFSISTREVVAKPGDEDMLVEEYGERAVEARRPSGYGTRSGRWGTVTGYGSRSQGTVKPLDVSGDEIADGEQPPPDSAS
jgi:hypothetical protein